MELNKDQHHALDKIGSFLKSEEKVISILGKAGTGKSVLIKAINETYDDILITATTNEAAQVINGITIHKYLGFALGCIQENKGHHQPHHIILIDEASMLKLCIMQYLLSLPNKIILVGDPNQLTVGVTTRLHEFPFIELTQNMRAKSEHLKKLVEHLDEAVALQQYPKLKSFQGSHLEFIDNHKHFMDLIEYEQDEYIVLAYTNRVVEHYREYGYHTLTTHKSQGKSYPIVYIDATDLIHSHTKKKNKFNNPIDMNTYLRLLSVGISRAMYKVVCFTGEKRQWRGL